MRIIKYSKSEEALNIATHILGFILSLIFFLPVVLEAYRGKDTIGFMAWLIYFIAIAIMFLSSSLYHSMKNPLARTVFRAIDHGVIYLTIAGSYTPIIHSYICSNLDLSTIGYSDEHNCIYYR